MGESKGPESDISLNLQNSALNGRSWWIRLEQRLALNDVSAGDKLVGDRDFGQEEKDCL